MVSRNERKDFHAKGAKKFMQRTQRVSRKERKDFHAKSAKVFTQRAQRVSRKERKGFHAKSAKIFTQRAQSFHAMVFLFFACFARSLRALREKKITLDL